MGTISKSFALILLVIMALSSLIIVESASAQSISTPSVPEYTVQLVDRSYDESPTYQTDPYTGQTALIWDGRHVDNKTFDFTIKNQPFTPYKNADGKDVELYYKIRHKGQFEEWSTIFAPKEDIAPSSGSGNTFVSFIVGEGTWGGISPNGSVDIQVKSLIVYYSLVDDPYNRPWDQSAVFTAVGESDWSNTQTITLADGSVPTSASPNPTPTSTQNPTPTPTVPELSWLVVVPLIVGVFAIAVILRHRKTISQNKPNI
jgi:hypothetical protein